MNSKKYHRQEILLIAFLKNLIFHILKQQNKNATKSKNITKVQSILKNKALIFKLLI